MTNYDRPVRILIIDDNIGDVGLLREALKEECPDCEITHLDNGERALDYLLQRGEYVQSPTPELIILDLNMPRIDGHEVLNVVRSTPRLSGISVSVLSSSSYEMARAGLMHPNHFFQKPFDLDDFLSVAKQILRQFRTGETANAGEP